MMTLESIRERMKTPSVLAPREVTEAFMFLSAVYAERSQLLASALADLAIVEAQHIEQGTTSAAAKVLTNATPAGQSVLRLKGEVKGLEEMIKALKKAQQFYADEAKNLY